jgi:hypothetical protein
MPMLGVFRFLFVDLGGFTQLDPDGVKVAIIPKEVGCDQKNAGFCFDLIKIQAASGSI